MGNVVKFFIALIGAIISTVLLDAGTFAEKVIILMCWILVAVATITLLLGQHFGTAITFFVGCVIIVTDYYAKPTPARRTLQ